MTKNKSLAESIQDLRRISQGVEVEKTIHPVYPGIKKKAPKAPFLLTKELFWKLFNFYAPASYTLNQSNQTVIFTVMRYFIKDVQFNEYGLVKNLPSLDKGLLIYGSNGVGKSLLFEILHKVGKELITKANCNDVWFSCISAGSFVDEYMRAAQDKDNSEVFDLKNFYHGQLYIDDLGFEKKAFNKNELLGEILFERNRKKAKTFATTNLKPSQITDRYGDRIGDRLPEMFNIINWNGESFRK